MKVLDDRINRVTIPEPFNEPRFYHEEGLLTPYPIDCLRIKSFIESKPYAELIVIYKYGATAIVKN